MLTDTSGLPAAITGLANIKKEEPGPDLSSDGFVPLSTSLNVATSGIGAGTSGNGNGGLNIVGGSNSANVVNRMQVGNSPDGIQQSLSATAGVMGNTNTGSGIGNAGNMMGGNNMTGGVGVGIKNQQPTGIGGNGSSMGVGGGGTGGTGPGGLGTGGGSCNTGMDYMQQQNHIFVFSTSLANKGAESVLSGQYSTIIAYHCAQPSTKKFLEDFFLKNPLKLSKMNRQNPTQWMNNNIMGTKNVKGGGNNANNNSGHNNSSNSSNISTRMVSSGGGVGTKLATNVNSNFGSNSGGPNDDLNNAGADAELLPWEQPGNLNLDSISNGSGGNLNVPTSSDATAGLEVDSLVPGSPSLAGTTGGNVNNRSCSNHGMAISSSGSAAVSNVQQSPTIVTSAVGPTSPSMTGSLQPSLQGVKVPDENLTPQQRQHREEQLAKLKKMNQFLFPEQGGMTNDYSGVGGGSMSVDNESVGGATGPKMMSTGPPGNSNQGSAAVSMMAGLGGAGGTSMSMAGGIGNIGPMRGSNMMGGMGPRGSMCRPIGPLGLNPMPPDSIMGNVPPNNAPMSDMSGMSCGMMMGGNQQGPNNPAVALMGNNNNGPMGPLMSQQGLVQGGPMGPGGPINSCGVSNSMSAASAAMMGQNKHMLGGPGVAQMEWNKLQHQFYEERKGKGLDNMGLGGMLCQNYFYHYFFPVSGNLFYLCRFMFICWCNKYGRKCRKTNAI